MQELRQCIGGHEQSRATDGGGRDLARGRGGACDPCGREAARGFVGGRLAAVAHINPHLAGRQHHATRATRLAPMTADTRELVAAARRCVGAAWRDGFAYAKAGVLLDDLRPRG